MLQLDDFSYYKATNTRCMDLFFEIFFGQHWFLRIQMPVIFRFFNTRDLLYTLGRCAAHPQSNW